MRAREDYIFFFGPNPTHAYGWASQWYPAPFTASVCIDGEDEKVTCPTAEHWMMLNKALLFQDTPVAREVLQVTGSAKVDLTYVKKLGRKVHNFDEKIWEKERERIVLEGNLHKFRQNEKLKEKLLHTGDKIMVEAAPRDRVWGIGMGEVKAMSNGAKWGLNLLGKALGETRKILREEQSEAEAACNDLQL